MSDIFDDGFGIEEWAFILGLSNEIAEEEKKRLKQLHDEPNYVDEIDDDLAWYEKE